MSTTLSEQYGKRIRDKPMEVYITFQSGEAGKISRYTTSGSYKSYDSTLGNTDYSMRNLADLAGDGFPLDGSCSLYDPAITPSGDTGKLGYRGTAGQNLTITITANATLNAVTVATRGVATIQHSGTDYPVEAGNNVIPIGATTATLTLIPDEENGRAEVDYIVPGLTINISNDNLIRCTLALRGNLDIVDHTWQESEIEFDFFYPYNLGQLFAYVQNDWPITYKAGYDGDYSRVRFFYLSEPITQKDNIITIHGVDASHWLNDKMIKERWFITHQNTSRYDLYWDFVNKIKSAGITLRRRQGFGKPTGAEGTRYDAVLPEMSTRDFVSNVMNLTLNRSRDGVSYGIQFVDAGIPTIEHGDGKHWGWTWGISKINVGDFEETVEQNISKITNEGDHKFNETVTRKTQAKWLGGDTPWNNNYGLNAKIRPTDEPDPGSLLKAGEIFEVDYDGYMWSVYGEVNPYEEGGSGTWSPFADAIQLCPTHGKFKSLYNSFFEYYEPPGNPWYSCWMIRRGKCVMGYPAIMSGGTDTFTNPNGLPGSTIEMEPFAYGRILDPDGGALFNYPSLFYRSNSRIKFKWKGDPRMQPLDYINFTLPNNEGVKVYRVTSIELTHEGGGTIAEIEAREWGQ